MKMILFSQLVEMLTKNHVYFRFIVLHLFEKVWDAAQSLRNLS